MYIHHDVAVDASTIVDAFVKRQPRRLERGRRAGKAYTAPRTP